MLANRGTAFIQPKVHRDLEGEARYERTAPKKAGRRRHADSLLLILRTTMASTEAPNSAEEILVDVDATDESASAAEQDVVEAIDPLTLAQQRADEYLELAQRGRAELENFRRRTAREREDLLRFGSEKVLRDLLILVDDMDRALEHAKDVEGPLGEGFRLMRQNLGALLERHHVTEVPGVGAPFNPDHHEAIAQIPSPEEKGNVAVVYQKGYQLHDRLLRAAMVAVSAGA